MLYSSDTLKQVFLQGLQLFYNHRLSLVISLENEKPFWSCYKLLFFDSAGIWNRLKLWNILFLQGLRLFYNNSFELISERETVGFFSCHFFYKVKEFIDAKSYAAFETKSRLTIAKVLFCFRFSKVKLDLKICSIVWHFET